MPMDDASIAHAEKPWSAKRRSAACSSTGSGAASAGIDFTGLTAVPGRMQPVGDGLGVPQLVVDYAHTPDALDKVLSALRPLAAARGGFVPAALAAGATTRWSSCRWCR